MIFENDALTFQLLDVLRLQNTCEAQVHRENRGRHFCALSFRVDTDARLTGGGVDVQLRPGAVAFLPANVDYQRRATHDELIVIHFDILNFSAGQIDCFYPDDPEDICRRFEEIHALWQRNAPGARYRATGLFYELFACLHTDFCRHGQKENPLVQNAMQLVAERYSDPGLTVSQMARRAGVCEVYLRRVFQQELQLTPKQYLMQVRMQRAVSLLQSGYYTVTQVAHFCGFTDEKYFSTAFKKMNGCQPSRYLYSFVP